MGHKVTLKPAYGKTVESVQDLKALWDNGGDFKIVGGCYASNRSFNTLKECYDIIVLVGCNMKGTTVFETTIYTHVLAGITHYV